MTGSAASSCGRR